MCKKQSDHDKFWAILMTNCTCYDQILINIKELFIPCTSVRVNDSSVHVIFEQPFYVPQMFKNVYLT